MRLSPSIDLKSFSVMMPCAPMLYSKATAMIRQSRHRSRHDGSAGEPWQAFVTQPARGVAPPAVLLQPDRWRAVGPGQRKANDCRANPHTPSDGAQSSSERLVQMTAIYKPQRPGMRPDGIGRSGSLMASTCRSNQSLTAWLVRTTIGPAQQARRQRSTATAVLAGAPEETMPQPNAHIGGNQVIGFSSSSTTPGVGMSAANTVQPIATWASRLFV